MAYGPAPVAASPTTGPDSTARQLSMAEAINEAICFEMRKNQEIILLGQDIGAYGGTFGVYKGIFDEFGPERVRDGPLCEAATAGFGIGLALAGHPTIVEIEFLDFITLVTDALVNQAAKMRYFFGGQIKIPLILRAPIVSRLGLGGAAQPKSGGVADARALVCAWSYRPTVQTPRGCCSPPCAMITRRFSSSTCDSTRPAAQ